MDIYRLIKMSVTAFLFIFVLSVSNIFAVNDSVFPPSIQIQSDYILSDTVLTLDDTLTIQRTCINNEATPLTCFYYSENLPNNFSIVSHSVTVNNISVSYDYPTPVVSTDFPDCYKYYWVLDYPGTNGVYNLLIQPDDTIVVEYKVVCPTAENYALPLHTFIGHNETTGTFGFSDSLTVRFYDVSLDIDDRTNLPEDFSLGQNYPNPFNPTTKIEFSIPVKSYVTIEIINLLGQSVTKLIQKNLTAGNHSVTWNGLNENGKTAPSGVYFYTLLTKDRSISKKMILLK